MKKMASMEETISTKDPDMIKKKRSTLLRLITVIHKNLAKLLERTAESFDHTKIVRARVLTDLANLKKHHLKLFTRLICTTEKKARTRPRRNLLFSNKKNTTMT